MRIFTLCLKEESILTTILTFKANDPNYMLIGTDGGIYESFDDSETWKLLVPLTQFYKLAVDDAEPFYNVYGGTQDNNTQGTFQNF